MHEDAWPSARTQLDVVSRAPGSVDGAGPAVTTIDAPWHDRSRWGDGRAHRRAGPCPGARCARVVEDGVLFGGDTLVTAIPPVFADGHSTILERTLRRLADIDVEVAVPGHGRPVRGLTQVRRALHRGADLLADTREQVGSLFGPHDADEVATSWRCVTPGLRSRSRAGRGPDATARAHGQGARGEVGLRPAKRRTCDPCARHERSHPTPGRGCWLGRDASHGGDRGVGDTTFVVTGVVDPDDEQAAAFARGAGRSMGVHRDLQRALPRPRMRWRSVLRTRFTRTRRSPPFEPARTSWSRSR